MKLLAFGAGGLTAAMQRMESIWDVDVVPLKRRHVDVRDYAQVVDAIDERAHRFYAHYGFTPIAGGMRLFARNDAVSASIAHAR